MSRLLLRSRDHLVAVLEGSNTIESERALARAAGLSHSTVNHLVTGRRFGCSPATAAAIESALGCPPGSLFSAAP